MEVDADRVLDPWIQAFDWGIRFPDPEPGSGFGFGSGPRIWIRILDMGPG